LTRRIKIPSFIPPWRDIMKEIFKKLIVDFIEELRDRLFALDPL
jgi:hypothetical protein